MSHFWMFVTISVSVTVGWILHGVVHRKALEEAVDLVHQFDEENQRLTVNILDLHRTRREHDCEKKP
jgi:hypothetical protein